MNNIMPLEILLIEDNDQDAELTIRAMREYNMGNKIVRLSDGQEAMDYFFSTDGKNNEIPRLILLDIKLPGFNGLEVLKQLKSHDTTRTIPVVILTSSTEEKDIQACYRLGVNSYISKPVEFDSFQNTMKTLGMYWLLMNRAP
ncbi:MAG: response regulator receiver protein [uncultured bacterium]|nr:MAG: response regulator receiver protein [uncultured bacterium]HCS39802.1 two-component system response regulator [Anaerolineaceae bacterium]